MKNSNEKEKSGTHVDVGEEVAVSTEAVGVVATHTETTITMGFLDSITHKIMALCTRDIISQAMEVGVGIIRDTQGMVNIKDIMAAVVVEVVEKATSKAIIVGMVR
jgi:hypothetical protein